MKQTMHFTPHASYYFCFPSPFQSFALPLPLKDTPTMLFSRRKSASPSITRSIAPVEDVYGRWPNQSACRPPSSLALALSLALYEWAGECIWLSTVDLNNSALQKDGWLSCVGRRCCLCAMAVCLVAAVGCLRSSIQRSSVSLFVRCSAARSASAAAAMLRWLARVGQAVSRRVGERGYDGRGKVEPRLLAGWLSSSFLFFC